GVGQAAVLPSTAGPGMSVLLAFFTPGTVDRSELYQVLSEHLPAHMIPSVLVGLSAFPRTSNGKVDRMRLLEDHAHRAAPGLPGPIRSETQITIADVWKKVLGHGDIQPDSNFFEVGGTSLTVFVALHRLREAFALDRSQLSDQSIYRFPTVETLASFI